MARRDSTEPSEDDQAALIQWRTFFEKQESVIQSVASHQEKSFSYEIEYSQLEDYLDVLTMFREDTGRCLRIGNKVLREQFKLADSVTRPSIRVINFPEEYNATLDEVRTRDRGRILRFEGLVISIGPINGWIKEAFYECEECGLTLREAQSFAMPVSNPEVCKECLDKLIEEAEKKGERGLRRRPPALGLNTEESFYEDYQVVDVIEMKHLDDPENGAHMAKKVILFDELVGSRSVGDRLYVNGKIHLNPTDRRGYDYDTRRSIVIRAHSTEFIERLEF